MQALTLLLSPRVLAGPGEVRMRAEVEMAYVLFPIHPSDPKMKTSKLFR